MSIPPAVAGSQYSSNTSHEQGTSRIKLGKEYVDLSIDVDDELEDVLDNALPVAEYEDEGPDDDISSVLKTAESFWTDKEKSEILDDLKENGMIAWIKEYVIKRQIPVQKLLWAFEVILSRCCRDQTDNELFPFLKVVLARFLRTRDKLKQYNTVDDAVRLIKSARRIVVLTGAGISVSCGIPDFRSHNGLYAMLQEKGEYDLEDPQQMFDIQYFREKPSVFYSFAHKIYPSNFTPSPCHRFIKILEEKGKLLRNYTQNIDTLETSAGIQRVLQCHGSFASASCIHCHHTVPGTDIEDDILTQKVPICKLCNVPRPPAVKKHSKKKKRRRRSAWNSEESEDEDEPAFPPGIMKPDITFFGEKLTDDFDRLIFEDRDNVDLLLIMGTSLKVTPVSEILTHFPHSVPQIVINKTPIKHINPDITLLGNADSIVQFLSAKTGWQLPDAVKPPADSKKRFSDKVIEPKRVGSSHVWLFEGAEGGSYVTALEKASQELTAARPRTSQSALAREGSTDSRSSKRSRVE